MADTAVETVLGIIEQQGGTSTARTLVPALVDLGEIIAVGGGGDLPDGSVTTAKLADEAVTTGKIDDGAVTLAKLGSDVPIGGGGSQTSWYGTCSTTATTAAKVVTCEGFTLDTGARIAIKFSNANGKHSGFSLNVNDTGAKTVYVNGYSVSSANTLYWGAGTILTFVYDGTYWCLEDKAGCIFATSSTDAATATKGTTNNIAGQDCVPIINGTIAVIRFSQGNTSTSTLKLNLLGTTDATIQRYGADTSSSNQLLFGENSSLVFIRTSQKWLYVGGDIVATS